MTLDFVDAVFTDSAPDNYRRLREIGPVLWVPSHRCFLLTTHEEAVRAFMKVDLLHAYPEWSAGALYEAGRVFLDLRKPAEARTQFTTVVESHPDTEWARLAQDQLERLGVRRPD